MNRPKKGDLIAYCLTKVQNQVNQNILATNTNILAVRRWDISNPKIIILFFWVNQYLENNLLLEKLGLIICSPSFSPSKNNLSFFHESETYYVKHDYHPFSLYSMEDTFTMASIF
jgi:hypothetical protein